LEEGESDYAYRGSTTLRGLHDGSRLELRFREKKALFDSRIRVADNRDCEYYLIEVEKFPDIIKSDLDEWIYLFKSLKIKEDFKSKTIQRVGEKLDVFKMSEREYKAYERYMLDRAYAREVLETAKMEGRVNGMAEAMLANHQPLEKIKLYTGLSEAEILQLKSG
jgi:predicted transposase/invertase (TIGR01784 family)